MSSALLQDLVKCLAALYALLFVGMLLRAKVPLFRKLLLPASVIGGFVGLLLGPQVWGEMAPLAFSESFITTWSLLPGVLILPIFASVPLGNGMDGAPRPKGAIKRNLPRAMLSCGLYSISGSAQILVGFGFTLLAAEVMPSLDLYRTFGYELSQGFSGGHGTAGALGAVLEGYGLPYWQTAQGVATTFATIGLMGGMLLGIYVINRGAGTGKTQLMDKPSALPAVILDGFTKNKEEQPSMGRETTNSSSIETVTAHLGVILLVCGMAYYLLGLAWQYNIPGLSAVPVWFYGLILMYGANFLLKKLGLSWMIDKKVKARIVGAISDVAIVAAIASMSVSTVMVYAVPILILAVIGFAVTYFLCFPMYRFCFGKNDYYFERALMSWGANTGITINGMMLLKICDPNYETPALNDFSMGFAMMSIVSIFTYPISYALIATGSTQQNFTFAVLNGGIYLLITIIGALLLRRTAPEQFAKDGTP